MQTNLLTTAQDYIVLCCLSPNTTRYLVPKCLGGTVTLQLSRGARPEAMRISESVHLESLGSVASPECTSQPAFRIKYAFPFAGTLGTAAPAHWPIVKHSWTATGVSARGRSLRLLATTGLATLIEPLLNTLKDIDHGQILPSGLRRWC